MRPFKYRVIVLAIALFAGSGAAGAADVPAVMHYQARLSQTNGSPVEGTVNAEVWIYDSALEGVDGDLLSEHLLYAESHESARVERGMLRLSIGEGRARGRFAGTSLPVEELSTAPDVYLLLYINGEKTEPRQRAGHEVFAQRAQYARVAENITGAFHIPASSLPEMDASKTYGTVPAARVPQMDASRISGSVGADRLPALSLDRIVTGTLLNAVIGEIDSLNITAGKFPIGTMPTGTMLSDSVYIEAGDISDGGTVAIPAAFRWPTALTGDCDIAMSLKNLDMPVYDGSKMMADDLFVYAETLGLIFPMGYRAHCEAEHERACAAWEGTWPRTCTAYATRYPCTASYLMVCVK